MQKITSKELAVTRSLEPCRYLFPAVLSLFLLTTLFYPAIFIIYAKFLPAANEYLRFTKDIDLTNQDLIKIIALYIPVIAGLLSAAFLKTNFANKLKFSSIKNYSIDPLLINGLALILIILYILLIFKYRNIMVVNYLHTNKSPSASLIYRLSGFLDISLIAVLTLRMAYSPQKKRYFGYLDGLILGLYIAIKVIVSARLGIVVVCLMWFYTYHFVWGYYLKRKRLVLYFLVAIISLVGVNYRRALATSGVSLDLAQSLFRFGLEYYYASLSLFNGLELVSQGYFINAWHFFADPFIYSVPTFFFGSHAAKIDLVAYAHFIDAIGGKEMFNPVGGSLLPMQVYLASRSHLVVYCFYLFLGLQFRFFCHCLFNRSGLFVAIGLVGLSLYFVSSFRTPFYIQQSYFLRNVIGFNVVLFGAVSLLGILGSRLRTGLTELKP